MPHDIIDNQKTKLVDVIQKTLPSSAAAHFAVGYFFLSGLEAVTDSLANVKTLRLLVGNTTNRQTIEQISKGYGRLQAARTPCQLVANYKRARLYWEEYQSHA